jgi:hypothetical protein
MSKGPKTTDLKPNPAHCILGAGYIYSLASLLLVTLPVLLQVIKWDVEILFVNINRKLVLRGQPETTRVWQLIRDQVELTPSQVEALTTSQNGEDEATSLDDNDPFILYRSVGYGGLRLYLKCETPVYGRRFYELDLRRSLRSNLRGKTIVEHPVLHVAMKADECVYRAPADAFQTAGDLPERKGGEGETEVGEQEAVEDANPEAFGQYFDFYLNYYTQKFAKESGGATSVSASPQQRCDTSAQLPRVTSSAGNVTSPAVGITSSAGNVTSSAVGVTSSAGSVSSAEAPGDSVLPPPEFGVIHPPDLSPFAAVGSNKSKHRPAVAAHRDSAQAMDMGGADGSKNQRPVSSQSGRTRYTSVPLRNAALEQALAVKNKLNAVRAQKLREELRQSALVAYDDSDSE